MLALPPGFWALVVAAYPTADHILHDRMAQKVFG